MIICIAGSRTITPSSKLLTECLEAVNFNPERDEVISGGAQGVDMSAASYCMDRGIPFTEYAADWKKHGKAAGPIRNREMAEDADILILIWSGKSPGSRNMKGQMIALGKKIHEVIINEK